MKSFKQFLVDSQVVAHDGDEDEDEFKTTPLKDLSKMLHSVEIVLRPPEGAEEVHWDKISTDEVVSWFEWDQYIQIDFIATTKDKALAAAKETADSLKRQGAKLLHARYKIRDLAHERRIGTPGHNMMRDIGPQAKDITL